MSDKEKPDFDSLDFSNLKKEKGEEAIVVDKVQKETQVEVTQETSPPVAPKKNHNTWIDGSSIEEVTSEEMRNWIKRIVGIEVDAAKLDTVTKRIKAVNKVFHLNKSLSYLNIGHTNKDHKEYKN